MSIKKVHYGNQKIKEYMVHSETGVHWLAGKTVKIVKWDLGETWEDPIVLVEYNGEQCWMNPRDFEKTA